ncbi:MAG: type 4a pilus biogenesis protein PilO [Parcubacteria group bacterium]|nr:type 4a pilus biogenesis protein PilO [Parcubacteria group bacterium]
MRGLLKNRFMISTIAFALLLVALAALIIFPSYREIKVINQQVLEERMRLEKLYTQGQLQKAVQQNYESIKQEIGFLDEVMLAEREELAYITAVERVAEEAGVELDLAIGDAKRVPDQRFSELGFTLTARGDWEQLVRFVGRLESLPYYTNISEMTTSARENEPGASRHAAMTIGAATYWRIPSIQ